MSTAEKRHYTVEEYLDFERSSESKHEYFDGEIFAMVGASPAHNVITGNVITVLNNLLRETSCIVYPSDQRVKVEATGLYTYPDVTVVCSKPEFEKKGLDSLLNPKLIVEVLSESTSNYDRKEKFAQYQTMSSFEQYVLVSQKEHHVEVFTKQVDGDWQPDEARGLESSIELSAIGCTLALAEVYRRVEIP